MTAVIETRQVPLERAAKEMDRRMRDLAAGTSLQAGIVRLAFPVETVCAFDWLVAQRASRRIMWSGRDDETAVAGVGAADVVTGEPLCSPDDVIAQCRDRLGHHPEARYYGGFAFEPGSVEDAAWAEFGAAQFVVPRFEIINHAHGSLFACNILVDDSGSIDTDDLLRDLHSLNFERIESIDALPGIVVRKDTPDMEGWRSNVEAVLKLVDDGVVEKIVLARRATFTFDDHIDAATIIAKLRRMTRDCYHFCFQVRSNLAFMGTTPERLVRRTDRVVQSEVIAGTRPRSEDAAVDDALARDLLASEKDQLEHAIVRKCIRQKLHLLCESLEVDEKASLLQLERKQHLFSGVIGTVAEGVSDGELVRCLHPTPAVGGYPTEVAISEIARLEPFSRGWYASPIGWIGSDSVEFAVGIRSGLVEGNTVSVYSGAGIVAGSKPDDEWHEIENKIVDFVKVTSMR